MIYRVHVTVTYQIGIRYPQWSAAKPKIVWSAERTIEPLWREGPHQIRWSGAKERDGVQSGVYSAICHAENEVGEPLAVEDLTVVIETVEEVYKNKKQVKVNRRKSDHVSNYRDVYDEVMKRDRPLK